MVAGLQISGTPGEIYERHIVLAIFARWAPDLIEAAGVRSGERVLDVACGTGVVTRLLAERVGAGGRVVGLDRDPGMLAVARTAASRLNIEWLEGSAVKMPLPDAAFDAVVCQQGLQFFPDRPAALREMRRVLVPGGRLALSVWRSIDHAPGFRVLEQALARRIGPEKAALPPFSLGDPEAIRAMVAGAGFREVRVRRSEDEPVPVRRAHGSERRGGCTDDAGSPGRAGGRRSRRHRGRGRRGHARLRGRRWLGRLPDHPRHNRALLTLVKDL